MGHWRDGGIGNMAGSDDRDASEFTLLEKLAVLAGHSKTDAAFDVAAVADEAFNAIQGMAAVQQVFSAKLLQLDEITTMGRDAEHLLVDTLINLAEEQITAGRPVAEVFASTRKSLQLMRTD